MTDMKTLIKGYHLFHKKYFTPSTPSIYQELNIKGQAPKTCIIACCDSRIDPALITQSEPGDIFVVRNIANLIPAYHVDQQEFHGIKSAIEFAITTIKVKNIIVLGHRHCAGIKTLLANKEQNSQYSNSVKSWLNIAQNAKITSLKKINSKHSQEDIQHICEKESIINSLKKLTNIPFHQTRDSPKQNSLIWLVF